MLATREAANRRGLELRSARIILQGFGNVSSFAARLIRQELGAVIAGISTSQGGIINRQGIDLDAAAAHYREYRSLHGFAGSKELTNAELLVQDCDVLIPRALENAITGHDAGRIRASIVVEAANDCTEAEADRILTERGIYVVSDIRANAGDVWCATSKRCNRTGGHVRLDRANRRPSGGHSRCRSAP